MSELITGDAVVLGLRPARLPSRALAVCLDLLLAWVVYIALTLALSAATASLDAAAFAAVQVALFLLVLVGVPIAVETLTHGRSVGKLAAGLRVVREDGGPIRFRHALVRGAIGVVEIQVLFGLVACTASLVSVRGRRLGDVFAGTLVVRERVPVPKGMSVPPPPAWLAGEFAALDLSRVPDQLWLSVRQYLMRAAQLDPAVSRSLSERLADDVTAWTGAPAPQGMSAAVYLAGVVAERRRREEERFFPAWSGTGAAAEGTAAARLPVSSDGPVAPESVQADSPGPVHTPNHPDGSNSAPRGGGGSDHRRGTSETPSAGHGEGPTTPRGTGFVPPT
ncbi:RDD family protein [Streptomyces reniochalinae]|uniref:RDD family protein n=1 Tax=Streptomyces reniochalinae TaxID=2250578 RepID=A0A367EYF6_9ACTN|nr:RDD family protein [Streptomyces reniochalinae]RCG23196.1 RDD family protein [Streptomyces reniochalinae]